MHGPLRLVMLGTKDFALPTFEHLLDAGFDVPALVTQPDRPQGRKQLLIPAPIKVAAQARGVPVHQPEDVNAPEGVDLIRSFGADLLVTAAYGQILSAELLGVPRLGGINLHGSVLPKYRGAAPVARAIQGGETETGVTVIRMTPRVDAGGMIAVQRTPIGPDETSGDVEGRLAAIGAPLVVDSVRRIADGTAEILPQDPAHATRAPKLRKEDGPIDWSRPAPAIHDHVRAMQPWPHATTHWHPSQSGKEPVRLILHRTEVVEGDGIPGRILEAVSGRIIAAAGLGAVRLLVLQVPGGNAMPADVFLRGHTLTEGDRLGPADGPS